MRQSLTEKIVKRIEERELNEKIISIENSRKHINEQNTKVDKLIKKFIDGVRDGSEKKYFDDLTKEINDTITDVKSTLDKIVQEA